MAFNANLPVEHVGEVIAQHLQDRMEKAIRDALNKEVAPMVHSIAKEYAAQLCRDALVNTGHNVATGQIEISIHLGDK